MDYAATITNIADELADRLLEDDRLGHTRLPAPDYRAIMFLLADRFTAEADQHGSTR